MSFTNTSGSSVTISIYPNRPCFDNQNLDLDRLLKHPAITPLQRANLLSAEHLIEAVVQDLGGFDEASWYRNLDFDPLLTFGNGQYPFFVTRGTKLGGLLDIAIEIPVERDDEGTVVRRIPLKESDNFTTYQACLTLTDFAPRKGWFVGKAFGFTDTSYAHACRWVETYQGLKVAHAAEAIAFLEAHPHFANNLQQLHSVPVYCPANTEFCYEPVVNLESLKEGEEAKYRLKESDGDKPFYLIGIKRVSSPKNADVNRR